MEDDAAQDSTSPPSPEGPTIHVRELVVKPTWLMARINVGHEQLSLVRFLHPRHGPIDFGLPDSEIEQFAQAVAGLGAAASLAGAEPASGSVN